MKLTYSEVYNIKKYYNIEDGIKEIKPELLEDASVKHACEQIKLHTEYLNKYLEDNEIEEDLGYD